MSYSEVQNFIQKFTKTAYQHPDKNNALIHNQNSSTENNNENMIHINSSASVTVGNDRDCFAPVLLSKQPFSNNTHHIQKSKANQETNTMIDIDHNTRPTPYKHSNIHPRKTRNNNSRNNSPKTIEISKSNINNPTAYGYNDISNNNDIVLMTVPAAPATPFEENIALNSDNPNGNFATVMANNNNSEPLQRPAENKDFNAEIIASKMAKKRKLPPSLPTPQQQQQQVLLQQHQIAQQELQQQEQQENQENQKQQQRKFEFQDEIDGQDQKESVACENEDRATKKKNREKKRRDTLNLRFAELIAMLPKGNQKTDKESILTEAVEVLNCQNALLLESNLQLSILKKEVEELRQEKAELRSDKNYLRAECDSLREEINRLRSDNHTLWNAFQKEKAKEELPVMGYPSSAVTPYPNQDHLVTSPEISSNPLLQGATSRRNPVSNNNERPGPTHSECA